MLHVVDASNPQAEEHIQAVNAVLKELGCDEKPTLLVLNKIDRVQDHTILATLANHHPRSVEISAANGRGLDRLREAVIEVIGEDFAEAVIETDIGNGKVLGVSCRPRRDSSSGIRRFEGDHPLPSAQTPSLPHRRAGSDGEAIVGNQWPASPFVAVVIAISAPMPWAVIRRDARKMAETRRAAKSCAVPGLGGRSTLLHRFPGRLLQNRRFIIGQLHAAHASAGYIGAAVKERCDDRTGRQVAAVLGIVRVPGGLAMRSFGWLFRTFSYACATGMTFALIRFAASV